MCMPIHGGRDCRKGNLCLIFLMVVAMGAGQSELLWTFTIVTTAASSSFSWLHDRQPVILNSQDALDRWLDTSTQTWDPKLNRLLDPYNDSDAPLEWYVPNSHLQSNIYSPLITHSRAHANAYVRTLTHNSYAVPKEVGKVGVESPTFIEPVQNRKDGIEAMFTRQAKAAQQQQPKSESRDAPSAATAGSGKRKHEPAEEKGEEKKMGTATPSSPAKRSKVKKDPIKLDDSVGSEEEGNSDVEIVPYGPSSSPSQSQSVRHPTIPDLRAQLMTHIFGFRSWPNFRRRMKQVDRRPPSQSQRRRKRKRTSPATHSRVRSSSRRRR